MYLVGSWKDGWQLSQAIATTKNTDGTFSAVIHQVTNVEYKCWNRKDGTYEEFQADGSNLASTRQAVFKDTPVVNITIAGWKKMATSVKSLKADFTYPLSVTDKKITIEGVQTGMNIYNTNGQLMQAFKGSGRFTNKIVTSGIYILKDDKSETKILVKQIE
ncbi:MAG: hypothetical protein ACYC2P_08465 [Paludibacteraceae bacterium]